MSFLAMAPTVTGRSAERIVLEVDIAEESGVAVQTIYSSVGSKAALVLALNDLIDEEAGVAQLAAGVLAEADPPRIIAKAIHLTRQLNERCGDLLQVMLSAVAAESLSQLLLEPSR